MLESVKDYLKIKEVDFKENVNTSYSSTVRIGGVSELVVYPKSIEQLIYATEMFKLTDKRVKIVGRKSNVLFMDGELKSILVDTAKLNDIKIEANTLTALCGTSLPRLAKLAQSKALSGLEELFGIPGSVGGAVFGNAGAFGREICELVESVTVYDKELNEIIELSGVECGFSYRGSAFSSRDFVILSVKLHLVESERDTVFKRMTECKSRRSAAQPTLPSLGSTFKRPSHGYVGEMVEKCGLSGYKIGGAQISEKHAGFIVNTGGACASDYLKLMELASGRVFEKYALRLEPEIKIIN